MELKPETDPEGLAYLIHYWPPQSEWLMKTKKLKSLYRHTVKESAEWIGRTIPLRHRHFFTRNNNLRLRYVASPLALLVLSVSAGSTSHFSYIPARPADMAAATVADSVKVADSSFSDQAGALYSFYKKRLERYDSGRVLETAPAAAAPTVVASAEPAPARPLIKILRIGHGDTLSGMLERAGIAADDAYQMVQALQAKIDLRNLQPGQKMAVRLVPEENTGDYNLAKVDMPIDAIKSVSLEKKSDGTFKTAVTEKPVETKTYARNARIETSLYGSATKAGIPSDVIASLIKVYSYDVDFQRDIRRGDVAQVMYSQVETADGNFVRSGDMLFAKLVVDGRSIPIYRYEVDGIADYFTAAGKSVRKALMRTPVDGARISSGFGRRFHPVLGYTKMHKGEDFAAPIGTPIYAAGNGVVERCGPFSSFGNYIRIRHNGNMETAYAHMSRFAAGMRSGVRVRQGEIIGYIGRTGRVTGPHLHYEVLMSGKQVNPANITVAQGDALQGKKLAGFRAHVAKIDQQFAAASGSLKTASNSTAIQNLQ